LIFTDHGLARFGVDPDNRVLLTGPSYLDDRTNSEALIRKRLAG
jgi:hypothetical protein